MLYDQYAFVFLNSSGCLPHLFISSMGSIVLEFINNLVCNTQIPVN